MILGLLLMALGGLGFDKLILIIIILIFSFLLFFSILYCMEFRLSNTALTFVSSISLAIGGFFYFLNKVYKTIIDGLIGFIGGTMGLEMSS